MGVVENLAMLCATDIGGQRCARKLQAEEQLRNARNQFEVVSVHMNSDTHRICVLRGETPSH
eukprot:3940501-Rhodomonas_salina.5